MDSVWVTARPTFPAPWHSTPASLYARNITNLLQLPFSNGELKLDFADEIIRDCCVTHDGQITSEGARQVMGVAAREHQPFDRRRADKRTTCRPVYLLCAGRLYRLRGHLEGPHHPAHPAHVRLQRNPGIILVGALLIAANAQTPVEIVLGFVAVVLATINVVGGFVVTRSHAGDVQREGRPGRTGGKAGKGRQ